jgi:NAD(P)-dependent dehydrogenase (short-subunit alcohol dehydrogenase family)
MAPASPIILITGATRGIGFAAATQLAARGAQVIIGSRDGARASEAAAKIGLHALSVAVDLTDGSSIESAAKELRDRFGHLDVLVNNAAILLDDADDLLSLTPEVLRVTLETNLIGTFAVTKAFISLLRKSREPRIVNVSSGAGQLDGEPQGWAPAYSISKTAVNMLTEQMAAALPGISVNAMCPGWCRTAMGGASAPRSPETGAETITWLALDAPHSVRGGFYRDKKRIPW